MTSRMRACHAAYSSWTLTLVITDQLMEQIVEMAVDITPPWTQCYEIHQTLVPFGRATDYGVIGMLTGRYHGS